MIKTTNSYKNSLMNIQGNLLSYAYILTSDRETAYRLLSDTTSAALTHRRRYDGRSPLKDWAFTVMRTIFIKKYAAARRMEARKAPAGLYSLKVEETATEAVTHLVDESRLRIEIATLPRPCAEAYCLFISGYTPDEITRQCNMCRQEVTAHIAAASRQMAELFN